ncbi:MAG: hypothetical protein AAFX79_12155 [Planctomycetota bacterium]
MARPRCSPVAVERLEPRVLLSVEIDVNYDFDTNGFFDDPDRRAVIEYAADYLGGLLDDSLAAIIPGGGRNWEAVFFNPSTGTEQAVDNPTIAEDTIRVYVGGRDLGGSTLGRAGFGGARNVFGDGGGFFDTIVGRGQPGAIGDPASRTDFGLWGGSITFDTENDWFTGITNEGLLPGQSDLLSVALHEMTHVLGFIEGAPSFDNLIESNQFVGAIAIAEHDLRTPRSVLTFDGSTAGGPIWTRPAASGTIPSMVGVGVTYEATPFTVPESGSYDVLVDQEILGDDFDGFLALYDGTFDPSDPLANLIGVNDDYFGDRLPGMGPGYSGIEDLDLVAGRDLVIVVTGYDPTEAGTYRVFVSREDGRAVDLAPGDLSHWRDDLVDNGQRVLMAPTISNGERRLPTPLDLAALNDIGWEITPGAWPGRGELIAISPAAPMGAGGGFASAADAGLHWFDLEESGRFELRVSGGGSEQFAIRLWDSAGRIVEQTPFSASASLVIAADAQIYSAQVLGAAPSDRSYTLSAEAFGEDVLLYYPEGFASPDIDQTVWVTNPTAESQVFSLTLRYENLALERSADVIVENRLLLPGERLGIDIARDGVYATDADTGRGILRGEPYSMVLAASELLSAGVQHADVFDGQRLVTADDFTTQTSEAWYFARAEVGSASGFLVFHNPNDHAAVVEAEFATATGRITISQVVGANRRGGWNLNDTDALPGGVYGVTLTSRSASAALAFVHEGVVAALSHYDAAPRVGWTTLGSTAPLADGVLVLGTPPPGVETDAYLFNPALLPRSVSLFATDGGVRTFVRAVTLQPGETRLLIDSGRADALEWEADAGVVAQAVLRPPAGDAASARPPEWAARSYYFGVAELSEDETSATPFGTLGIASESNTNITVTVRFTFGSGVDVFESVLIAAEGFATLELSSIAPVRSRAGDGPMAVTLTSDADFFAMLTSYDAARGEAWTTGGVPLA